MTTASDWKGRVGQVWAESVDALDAMLQGVGTVAIEQMGPIAGKHVLDLGCGAGQTTAELLARGATVTGADISDPLLAVARERPECAGASFISGDAANADLDGPYDYLYSRCGAMFFDDPVAAYIHIREQVGPECQMMIACWAERSENEWATIPMTVGSDLIGKQPETGAAGPFAWESPRLFAPILSKSGWQDVTWDPISVQVSVSMGDDPDPVERAVLFISRIGPLARVMSVLDKDQKTEIHNRLREILHHRVDEGIVKLDGKAWIIKGRS